MSIQIIDKSSGRYVVRQTVGSSSDPSEIAFLEKKAHQQLVMIKKQGVLGFDRADELAFVDTITDHLGTFSLVGPELLLGRIFDQIGFNAIEDSLFRDLVLTRLVFPVSKLRTVDYLFKYKGIEMSVYSIYRYLDKLHKDQIELVKAISLRHTLKLFSDVLSIVFYDVTTLYFEASEADDLRKLGFSKDGKHQQPQIVLGLLVSENGYPLDYDIFDGNKYEGDTLLPVIEHFQVKYSCSKLIVVADAGLLSARNIGLLKAKNYQYILGARIKNESEAVIHQILSLQLQDNESQVIPKGDQRLIVSYKESRALKDAHNRKRGLEKLEKDLKSGKLNKTHINNKGYNKYLKLQGDIQVTIDYQKYQQDAAWDGLKGYLTNAPLAKQEIIDKYNQLWNIERTFRISKSDLQIRPIYHRLKRRIESHICISFAACKVYKELERQLEDKKSAFSAQKAIDIIKTIYKVDIQTPYSPTIHHRLIVKNHEQQEIIKLFDLKL